MSIDCLEAEIGDEITVLSSINEFSCVVTDKGDKYIIVHDSSADRSAMIVTGMKVVINKRA